jgi:hypothetical protein
MNKHIIAVSAYCPDEERLGILRSLLISLGRYRGDFDILVYSGTPISEDFFGFFDHLIYDSSNDLLDSPDLLPLINYNPSGVSWCMSSSYFQWRENTHLAAKWKFISPLMFTKSLGYDVMHFMEFDTMIDHSTGLDFLKTPFSDLNEDLGFVTFSHGPGYAGIPYSINLRKNFPSAWFHYPSFRQNEIEKIKKSRISGQTASEIITHSDFTELFGSSGVLDADRSKLGGNKFGFYSKIPVSVNKYFCVYYDNKRDKIGFFIGVNGSGLFESSLEIFVNGKNVFSLPEGNNFSGWSDRDLDVHIEDLREIKYIFEGQEKIHSFESPDDRETFKLNSWKHYMRN